MLDRYTVVVRISKHPFTIDATSLSSSSTVVMPQKLKVTGANVINRL